MKTIKGLATFVLLCVALGACFNPPEFSVVPNIRYESVIFKENPNPVLKDSLVIIINFQDGDGDLGLDVKQTDDPYHFYNYYLVNDGDSIALSTFSPRTYLPAVINVPEGATGKLVTKRTRVKQPEYAGMFPAYICPFQKTSYATDSIYVLEQDANIFDAADHHVAKEIPARPDFNQKVYVLKDTFAIRKNPYFFNIRVDFLIKQTDQTFKLFPWEDACGPVQDFSARFPVLSNDDNPLEGTLRYGMGTVGFHPLFDGKTLKLRIRIWDRALHASNVIETPPFTLQDIKE
jgi:hypothetical protein